MTEREYVLLALAREAVAASFERLGQHISARVMAGAIKDAGGLDGYATPHDYELALADFIDMRRRHDPRFALPPRHVG